MNQTAATHKRHDTSTESTLYIAFELSNSKWKLGFGDGGKIRRITIDARDLERLGREVDTAKKKFHLEEKCRIRSCYEAGRDGFWLHRYLTDIGFENIVVDSSSIEVNRRKRRAKTDRIDVEALLRMLLRYHGGEKKLWSIARVPSHDEEDARRLHRELERLKKERTSHRNRIRSLLILHGIALPSWRNFPKFLESIGTLDCQPLPRDLKAEILREHERTEILVRQIKELQAEQASRVKNPEMPCHQMIKDLTGLSGVGTTSSWVFVMEFFAWRNFKNRREIASLAGLTPTPFDSGGSQREQGISKAGNRRVRSMAIEIAWCWLRFQPNSKLSLWYQERFGNGSKRMKRIGIVAVARKLLIEMWRFFEYGIVPEGALKKA